MTLGKKIEKLRQEKGLSQKELAVQLSIPTGTLAEWESDEAAPSLADIAKLSESLNISADVLIKDVEIESDAIEKKETGAGMEEKPATQKKVGSNKRIVIIALLTVLILSGIIVSLWLFRPVSSKPFSEDTSAIEKAASSVVKIYCYDYDGNESATGSGFVAFDDQTIVTNYHVMEEAYTCKVSTDQDKTLIVDTITHYSEESDIAILKLKEPSGLDVLSFGSSDSLKKGDTLTAIGSPLGLKNSVSKGILSGRVMLDSMDALQFTAEISHGSSGGALFNEEGEVVGVTFASYEEGQNLNLAIPIEKTLELSKIESQEISTNTIFLEKYPYIVFEHEHYKNTPTVTIEELKRDPEKWNGKTVKIIAYISSLYPYDYSGSWVPIEGFITDDLKKISGIVDWDEATDSSAEFESTPFLRVFGSGNGKDNSYVEEGLELGNKVCVIGKFEYKSHSLGRYNNEFDLFIPELPSHGELTTVRIAYSLERS